MNILVLGSGGREHTLAWKIKQSPLCDKIYVAPGNAGTSQVAENIDIHVNDFEAIAEFIDANDIGLLVIGPEDPLVNGLRDFLEGKSMGVKIVGPGAAGALLEGSKDFSKLFMAKNNIPTARYQTFTADTVNQGIAFLKKMKPPIVLKADGLAAGKGVIISPNHEEAEKSLKEMLLDRQFGDASDSVVIEEFLDGIELSVFVLTNGKEYKILPEAKDYKRIGENDTGPNTGGMGAVSPVHFADQEFIKKVEDQVIKPTISGLKKDNIDYCGFLFIGLMNIEGSPYVIEYNVRMGDPETQAVVPRIKSDFLELLIATVEYQLNSYSLDIDPDFATTVVMVSGGYPGSYTKGNIIKGLNEVDALLFHAGTREDNGLIQTTGGRVLAVTGRGKELGQALKSAYTEVDKIHWKDSNFRKDIGQDLIQ